MLRIVRETFGITVQDFRPRFDEQHFRRVRIDRAEIPGERVVREVGDRAGQFDARGAGADDHKGQQRLPPYRIGLALGFLERQEDAAANGRSVLDRLQAGRHRLPFVMAEIAVPGARRENQRLVGNRAPIGEAHGTNGGIDADNGPEPGRDILAIMQHRSDRPCDFRRRERRRRDLIQ